MMKVQLKLGWIIILLTVIVSFKLIKRILEIILIYLYRLFIQHN